MDWAIVQKKFAYLKQDAITGIFLWLGWVIVCNNLKVKYGDRLLKM